MKPFRSRFAAGASGTHKLNAWIIFAISFAIILVISMIAMTISYSLRINDYKDLNWDGIAQTMQAKRQNLPRVPSWGTISSTISKTSKATISKRIAAPSIMDKVHPVWKSLLEVQELPDPLLPPCQGFYVGKGIPNKFRRPVWEQYICMNGLVYMDLEQDGHPFDKRYDQNNEINGDSFQEHEKLGRIVIGLFGSKNPKSVENFKKLCTCELVSKPENTSVLSGYQSENFVFGDHLCYHGDSFHRVLPGFVAQGGSHGTDRSIYGETFREEVSESKHSFLSHGAKGVVAWAEYPIGSQFYIVLSQEDGPEHLDNNHVVFGFVLSGIENVVEKMNEIEIDKHGEKPVKDIIIKDSGEFKSDGWKLPSDAEFEAAQKKAMSNTQRSSILQMPVAWRTFLESEAKAHPFLPPCAGAWMGNGLPQKMGRPEWEEVICVTHLVYMDLEQNGNPFDKRYDPNNRIDQSQLPEHERLGRIVIALFGTKNPLSVENFVKLCTCELVTKPDDPSSIQGYNNYQFSFGQHLCFHGDSFHRVLPDFVAQGGSHSTGRSIYDETFEEKVSDVRHSYLSHASKGVLAYAEYPVGSQFYIVLQREGGPTYLDSNHIAFGYVISGLENVVEMFQDIEIDKTQDKPVADIIIRDSGEFKLMP